MKHVAWVSKARPAKAYYYNVSLTQKLSEVVTIVSLLESLKGMVIGA